MEQSSLVARFFCVVDSWPVAAQLWCRVLGPWLLDLCCVWNLYSGNATCNIPRWSGIAAPMGPEERARREQTGVVV